MSVIIERNKIELGKSWFNLDSFVYGLCYVNAERRDHKKRRVKSMFPVFSSKENRGKGALLQDCSDLAKVMYADKSKFSLNYGN